MIGFTKALAQELAERNTTSTAWRQDLFPHA